MPKKKAMPMPEVSSINAKGMHPMKKAIKAKAIYFPRCFSPKYNPMVLFIQVQMRQREDNLTIQDH
eukprot:7927820-Ditylum_brightwellii.AAC.1